MDSGAASYRRFRTDGDPSGLAEIIRDYKDGLILYLNSYVNNIQLAEELAEDTFVRLATRRPRDRGGCCFKTWLYTIGRHIAIDYLRRRSRHPVVSMEDHPQLSRQAEELERAYLQKEQKMLLHQAMAQLKPEHRQILWLVYFEDLSHRDAARIMGKTVHGIDTLVCRARASLKSELERSGFDYENS